ncbi:MAG: hypothetical protein Q9M89_02620 [Persephonella sp.]|nr:hypothetical protein [Persephonella sp.]
MGEVGDITVQKAETVVNGANYSIETGYFASQANGAVIVGRQGETAVLVTAVMSEETQADIDFFPLTVEYREEKRTLTVKSRGFVKREGKPSGKRILVSPALLTGQ